MPTIAGSLPVYLSVTSERGSVERSERLALFGLAMSVNHSVSDFGSFALEVR